MKTTCPRCGQPGYLVVEERELKTKVQTYYFIIHRYKDPSGRWRTRKCAIGASGYINVTKTHTLPVYGVRLLFSNIIEAENLSRLAARTMRELEKRLRALSTGSTSGGKDAEVFGRIARDIGEIERHLARIKEHMARVEQASR